MLKILGNFVRAIKKGETSAKAVHVLVKTYSLLLDQSGHDRMKQIGIVFGEYLNEHEMAVQFLAEFAKKIDPSHPKAKSEVTRYVRQAEEAKRRGLITVERPLRELLDIARSRFGVAHDENESGVVDADLASRGPDHDANKAIISCPSCQQRLRVPSRRHLRVSCPKCGKVFESDFKTDVERTGEAACGSRDSVESRGDGETRLTYDDKMWRLHQGDNETVLTNDNGEPLSDMHVVVLGVSSNTSRLFCSTYLDDGKPAFRFCWSSDGERPDKEVKEPCAITCASCPNSIKNSNQLEVCAPFKRLAVVPEFNMDTGPLLLKVPQTSLWDKNNPEAEAKGYFAWDQYVDFLRKRGVKHTAAVLTKIEFDPLVAYPKLLFTAARWLEAEEITMLVPLIESDAVKRHLTRKMHEEPKEPKEPATDAPPTQ